MNKAKKIITVTLVILGSVFAVQGVAQNIKLNPIKPGTKASAQISDEQQAILAVRMGKASVVSIIGVSSPSVTVNGKEVKILPGTVSGTGFILETDGLIATNYHVVENPNLNYTVVLSDGSEYPAKITATDKFDDVAFLKIETGKLLNPARLGDSDALETGQSVFAIGNSLGKYQNSVTRGVISGLSRAVDPDPSHTALTNHHWIQTDAAISPGNSGGPLINLAGEVVGMNTLIDTEGSSLGFALPINLLKEAREQLKTFGKVSRPFLGISFRTVDALLRLEKNLPTGQQGAYLVSVVAGSPAAAAGLMAEDIIISVNGQKVDQQHEVNALVQKYQAGNQLTLKILRGSQAQDLLIILGEQK